LTDQQYSLYYEPSPGFKTDETVTVRVRGVDNKQLGPLNFMDSTYTFQIGATEVVTIKSDTIDGTGGTIACPTNGVVMMVPPGGLNGPTIITIDTLSASGVPALPDSVEYGRTAFHFGPDGLVFNDTITIKIPYTESDLEQVQATDPFDLNLYYYSTRTGEWIKLNKARADSMYVFQRVKEFCYLVLCNEERIQTGSDQTIKTKPIQYSLIQNFPNPFNPSTTIRYSIQAPGQVRLVIYNTNGQIMDVPVVAYQQAGHYQISYENRDLPSGIYYYQIKTNGFVYTRKMVKIQ